MTAEGTLEATITAALGAPVAGLEPMAGGCVAEVLLVQLADGGRVVAKCRHPGQPSLDLEARMLDDLRAEDGLPVPAVLHSDEDLLLLEHVEHDAGGLDEAAERQLGALIGGLHARPRPAFGYAYDTLIGPLPQPNPRAERWVPFFAEHRLLHMADLAHACGELPDELRTRIDRLAPSSTSICPSRTTRPCCMAICGTATSWAAPAKSWPCSIRRSIGVIPRPSSPS